MSAALAYIELGGAGGRHSAQLFADYRSVGGADFHMVSPASLPMFVSVRLTRPWAADDENFPKGSLGVVVEALDRGSAYIVEFFEPRHGVMTVHPHALALA